MDLFTTFRSLLSRRKGSSNAELIIDTIRDIYEQRQETLQSRTEDKLEQLATNRTIEKAANQKRFENSLDNRVLYQDYLIRPRETINNYAIQLYNEDPNIEGAYEDKFKLVESLSRQEQSQYKYILNIQGYVSAFRLSSELRMNSVILICESDYLHMDLLKECHFFLN